MSPAPSSPHQDYEDCSGCTAPRSEGTHQSHTKQHPCPLGGDPDCGYCFPTQSSSEKLNVVNLPEPFPYKTLNIEVTTHASSSEKREFAGASYVTEKKCPSCLAGFSKEDLLGNCTCDDSRPYPSAEKERQDRAMNQIKENQELTSHVLFTHPNTEQEEMPQRIKNAYQLGAKTERARIRKLVEGMKKPNVAYVNIIRNRTLTDIFSLLEE